MGWQTNQPIVFFTVVEQFMLNFWGLHWLIKIIALNLFATVLF